jgi:hypothetical protein
MKLLCLCFVSAIVFWIANPLFATEVGRAGGKVTIDGKSSTLAFAVSYEEEDLYDSSKKNTAVVLTDRLLDDATAKNEWEIAQQAKSGELVAFTLRLNGTKLVNVRVNHAGVEGTLLLPGQWFEYSPVKTKKGNAAGSLKLATHTFEGHTYTCAVEFAAAPVALIQEENAKAETPEVMPEPPVQAAALPPATTNNLEPKSLTPLMVQAMMQKDEDQVLKLLKLGADPNAHDEYGTAMLNWAVMMCLPKTVKALVDAKADLSYQRAPGMTILTEAGACPKAEKILRAAGAH